MKAEWLTIEEMAQAIHGEHHLMDGDSFCLCWRDAMVLAEKIAEASKKKAESISK